MVELGDWILGYAETAGGIALGSESMTRILRSFAANAAARLMAVVVLPTPPFWFAIANTRLKRPY